MSDSNWQQSIDLCTVNPRFTSNRLMLFRFTSSNVLFLLTSICLVIRLNSSFFRTNCDVDRENTGQVFSKSIINFLSIILSFNKTRFHILFIYVPGLKIIRENYIKGVTEINCLSHILYTKWYSYMVP